VGIIPAIRIGVAVVTDEKSLKAATDANPGADRHHNW